MEHRTKSGGGGVSKSLFVKKLVFMISCVVIAVLCTATNCDLLTVNPEEAGAG